MCLWMRRGGKHFLPKTKSVNFQSKCIFKFHRCVYFENLRFENLLFEYSLFEFLLFEYLLFEYLLFAFLLFGFFFY